MWGGGGGGSAERRSKLEILHSTCCTIPANVPHEEGELTYVGGRRFCVFFENRAARIGGENRVAMERKMSRPDMNMRENARHFDAQMRYRLLPEGTDYFSINVTHHHRHHHHHRRFLCGTVVVSQISSLVQNIHREPVVIKTGEHHSSAYLC